MIYRNRILQLQNFLKAGEGALITSASNLFYLSGMKNEEAFIIVTGERAIYLTDFRYLERAEQLISSCDIVKLNNSISDIPEHISKLGIRHLYVETGHVTLKIYSFLHSRLPNVEIMPEERLDIFLRDIRTVKSPEELKFIETAQEMTDDTFKYILERIEVGRTEREIQLDMEMYMKSIGSEDVAFDTIVISGVETSVPHGVPTEKKIAPGDLITMDFGSVYNGYRSDMTRTVGVGRLSDEQKIVYNTVLRAQSAVLDIAGPGMECCKIDAVARDIIDDAGYAGCFEHALGHSVGIDIHEYPSCSRRSSAITSPNMVMTVEPGIYIPGKFGVRIEDMIFFTEQGNRNITRSPKELIIL